MESDLLMYEHSDPATAVRISQKAPQVLAKSSFLTRANPLSALFAAETPEAWEEHEQIFYSCLRTGDDKSAHLCLERLSKRFGPANPRVMALRGVYQEALAQDKDELRTILQEYNKILEIQPMNVPLHKRRIALIRSIDRPQEAIQSLVQFLETFPTDTEAWCELSDLYQSQGMLPQAIFCVEEALLIVPNAWNLQARLGELNFQAGDSTTEGTEATQRYLTDAVRRFGRSVELCEDYVRGYYGLKIATAKLLKILVSNKSTSEISSDQLEKLNKMATGQLQEAVKLYSSNVSGVRQSEIIAAQALLDTK